MSNCDVNNMEKNVIQKTLRSSFANGHSSLVIDAIKQALLNNMKINPSVDAAILSGDQQASSSRPLSEHGKTNAALYEANAGGIYGANPKQIMYAQETKEGLELVPDAASKRNFTACEVPCPSDIGDIQNMRHSNNYGLTPNFNSKHSIPDQMGLSGGQVLDGSIHGNSGNMNSTYYSPKTYSSAGFGSQLLQRFSNVNQQDNNPMLLSQQRYPRSGGDSSYLFDDLRTNDTAPGDGMYFAQLAGSDLHDKNFLNPQNNPTSNQVLKVLLTFLTGCTRVDSINAVVE